MAKDVDKVVVLNQGQRAYQTSAGVLQVGASIELPVAEAEKLLSYKDLVDASKLIPGSGNVSAKALKAENAKLKEANRKLEAKVAEQAAEIGELEEKLEEREKGDGKE